MSRAEPAVSQTISRKALTSVNVAGILGCVKRDGTIIDSVFSQEPKNDPELNPAVI